MSIPDFEPLTVDEVVAFADAAISDGHRHVKVANWVAEENTRRAAAKDAWQVAEFDLAGVTVKPGDVVNLTITPPYSKVHRKLNCYIIDRVVQYDYRGRTVLLRSAAYGGSPVVGHNRWSLIDLRTITDVEIIANPSAAVLEAIEYGRSRGAFDV